MPIEITFSELDTYATCPWNWWAKYVLLKRRKRKSVKLSFGAAIHKGVEAFYMREPDPVAVTVAYCDEVRRKAEEDGVRLDDDYELWLKKAEIVIRAYIAHYEDDFNHLNILTVEPSFSIPLVDDIVICGKIDRIVTEKRTGFFYPVETKTAASWDPDINRLMLDFQISLYSWAMSKMLHLKDVTFIYDILRKPSLRLKKNESDTELLARIEEDIAEDRAGYFMRDKITRSGEEIERTEKELIIRCRELVQRRQDGKIYRTSGDHCFWKCDYMPPCLESSEDMWDALYETVEAPHQELVARD